jgi:hypothetical protein
MANIFIPTREPTDVERAARQAAIKLLGMRPVRITGEADASDARTIIDDLNALGEQMFGPLLEAYAALARSELGVDLSALVGSVRDAIADANGLLEEKAEQLREYEHEVAADPRGHAKAERLGVE